VAVYDYRIAATWNVALNSLTNIETITPTGDKRFYPPDAYGSFVKGIPRKRGDGTVTYSGFPSVKWHWRRMTRKQHQYLMDTYGSGGYTGKVTIYTTTDNPGSYERYNAIINIPQPAEMKKNFSNFECEVTFSDLVAL
jgi:hypothetical protein